MWGELLFQTLSAVKADVRLQTNGPTEGRVLSANLAFPGRAAHLAVPKNRRSPSLARLPRVTLFSGKVQTQGRQWKSCQPRSENETALHQLGYVIPEYGGATVAITVAILVPSGL